MEDSGKRCICRNFSHVPCFRQSRRLTYYTFLHSLGSSRRRFVIDGKQRYRTEDLLQGDASGEVVVHKLGLDKLNRVHRKLIPIVVPLRFVLLLFLDVRFK